MSVQDQGLLLRKFHREDMKSSFVSSEALDRLNMKFEFIFQESNLVYSSVIKEVLDFWSHSVSLKKPSELGVQVEKANSIIKGKGLRNLHKIIDNLEEECEEEGFEKFSEIARENAKQILNFIYPQFSNYNYSIYPTCDKEIIIECDPQKGKGVAVICESNGSAVYVLTWDGQNRLYRSNGIDEVFKDNLMEIFNRFDSLTKPKTSSSSVYTYFLTEEKGNFSTAV